MELHLQIKMNPHLYLRDPETTELGRNIVKYGIEMIHELGFEEFTFRKLAQKIGTTEAGIYRYFENKHKLLIYLTTWFWAWLEYQIIFHTNNLNDSKQKIEVVIDLLTMREQDNPVHEHMNKQLLQKIMIDEGDKAYLTKHVQDDNKAMLFKPYKDLCHRVATIFLEYNAEYKFPHSLASTVIETANHQLFFKDHLPKLTDFGGVADSVYVADFIRDLIFNTLNNKPSYSKRPAAK